MIGLLGLASIVASVIFLFQRKWIYVGASVIAFIICIANTPSHTGGGFRPTSIASAATVAAIDRPAAPVARPEQDYCLDASKSAVRAFSLFLDKKYRPAYLEAILGLPISDECRGPKSDLYKGTILSAKGLAEHNITDGDSTTDINQAVALLARCQIRNYGEVAGAQCKTLEDLDIRSKVNWEMGR